MAAGSSSGKVELVSIQYLRGAAAMGVVVWHAQGQMQIPETKILQAGIEIFFVISGYIMWLILTARPVTPMVFLRKRVARIIPLYWALTTFMAAMLLLAPQFLQSSRFDLGHVIASYLFLPWPNPSGVGLYPLLIPGWTLNYETPFYLLLTLSLFLPAKARAPFAIAVLTTLGACSLLPLTGIARFYASPYMIEFVFGILLAIWLPKLPAEARRWGPWLFAAGAALLVAGGLAIDEQASWRLVIFGLPAAMIVAGLSMWESYRPLPRVPGLKAVGDASYPLYMIHALVLSVMAQAWRAFGLTDLSPWLYVVLALAVTSVIGYVAHLTLERWLLETFGVRERRAGRPKLAAVAP